MSSSRVPRLPFPHDAAKFKEFVSPGEMIHELKHDASHAESGKLNAFCRRIDAVSTSLSPFFDTIGIFVSSHPEIAAMVWGAIRMVFLLSSHYTNFLDKLLAMLEKISYRLPGYAEYYQKLVHRRQQNIMDGDISTLTSNRVLSYIYTDITRFCQEACKPFSTRRRGIRYKVSVIADVFWKPFDLRFKDILGRLEEHQGLFQHEFRMEESKFTEIQYRRRQKEAGLASAAAKQIQEQLELLNEEISGAEGQINTTEAGPLKVNPTPFDTRLRRIKEWLGAPDFAEELQMAQSARFPATCRWFLTNPVYQRKPGYGKTILSSLIIDDLNCNNTNKEPTLVLYYHFVSARVNESRPTHGLRAVLHQLVHQNRNRVDVMDILSVLMESKDSGQLSTTNSEVSQCLILLLKHIPDTTLVFDGIDECSDSVFLLQQVQNVFAESPTKVVFLGRPSVDLSPGMEHCGTVLLKPWENESDIRIYLQPKVISLHRAKLLPATSDCNEFVLALATRAQGMFLWAKLVIHYLADKSLTPRERHDAIHSAEILDGIENLYSKILQLLSQTSEVRKRKIKRIFQVMVATQSPLHISELQRMVAVVPGRVTTEDDLIADFEVALPLMVGALVELDSQGSVLFIHSSFRDYLLGIDDSNTSGFAIEALEATLVLMSICISYLTYDILRSRITDAEWSEDYRKSLKQSFPLLRYAIHIVSTFHNIESPGLNRSHARAGISINQLIETASNWLDEPAAEGAQTSPSNTILLMSRVSQDGILIGCDHLHPSKAYRNLDISSWVSQAKVKPSSGLHPRPSQFPQSAYSGWRLEYQIIFLSTQKNAIRQILDLQEDDIFEALSMQLPTGCGPSKAWSFRFPLTISRDLRQALLLRSISDKVGTLLWFPRERSYRVEFSPTEDAIAFVEAGTAGKLSPQNLEIWSKDPTTSNYLFRGLHQLGFIPTEQKSGSNEIFLFHPVHPMVVLAEWGRAALWWFEDQGALRTAHVPLAESRLTIITGVESRHYFINDTIQPLRFYNDVLYHNYHGITSHPRFVLKDGVADLHDEPLPISRRETINLAPFIEWHFRNCLPKQRLKERSSEQLSGSVTGDPSHTKSHLASESQSRRIFAVQEGPKGQEISIRLNRGQKMKYGHFPATPQECTTSVALLPNIGLDSTVRVAWNKEAQASYSVLDEQCRHLPSIIERSRAGLLSIQGHDNGSSRDAMGYAGLLTDINSNFTAFAGEEHRLAPVSQELDTAETRRLREPDTAEASSSQSRLKRLRRDEKSDE
ncbi:hypothetical protein PG994_002665 [Apiospora phragmitis]|uniref:NACHT domain-containing protein n=1 Tax=Apiospora phragmitis TaxID=2905665 RepID=A0ABR1W9L4_9PEZI